MTAKSEQTRQLVIDTALGMFRERGFEKTTMRAIAQEASISLGSAYYYFESKDDLVQELYSRIQLEHRATAINAIRTESSLSKRLQAVFAAGFTVMEPYHDFGTAFLQTAISPSNTASPFHEASSDSREDAIELFRLALDGASPATPASLRQDLPELLWLGYMALVFFWVNDRSENQYRSKALANGIAPLITRLLTLAKLPIARKVVEDAVSLIRKARS
ncbi:AcrR family transcriptional regulator [Psychromicrobium silvestre]|uniref:AcrR family transcriptional regulator n=1 Tax=Psychromicrobium silvestre TaxID=1645614 RepID=A0A7Y9LV83_9MICC|nr:TetR family transcriptional regulator [Psychromicrobium silvestre]NYE96250.1 AcrR family transcriptional regulator [Psychromicrobium silvestre]